MIKIKPFDGRYFEDLITKMNAWLLENDNKIKVINHTAGPDKGHGAALYSGSIMYYKEEE